MVDAAVEQIGNIGDDSAVPALLHCLGASAASEYDGLKHSTIDALGKIGDYRAIRPLIDVLKNHPELLAPRSSAEAALARIGDGAVDALIDELDNKDFTIVFHCAGALARMHPPPTERLIDVLASMPPRKLDTSDRTVVVEVGTPPGNETTRRQEGIALALGMIGDEEALLPLLNMLKRTDNYRVYPQAWRAVQEITGIDFRWDVRKMEEHIRAMGEQGTAADADKPRR